MKIDFSRRTSQWQAGLVSSPSKFPLASSLCVCRSPLELKIAVSNAVGVPSIRPFMEGASIVSGIAVITQETTFVAGSRRHGRMEAEPLPAHVRTGVYDFHAAAAADRFHQFRLGTFDHSPVLIMLEQQLWRSQRGERRREKKADAQAGACHNSPLSED
jgi:hypothetical protein